LSISTAKKRFNPIMKTLTSKGMGALNEGQTGSIGGQGDC